MRKGCVLVLGMDLGEYEAFIEAASQIIFDQCSLINQTANGFHLYSSVV